VIAEPGTTVKALLLVAVPPGVVTRIGPSWLRPATVARIEVAEVTVKLALTGEVTEVAPVKFRAADGHAGPTVRWGAKAGESSAGPPP